MRSDLNPKTRLVALRQMVHMARTGEKPEILAYVRSLEFLIMDTQAHALSRVWRENEQLKLKLDYLRESHV